VVVDNTTIDYSQPIVTAAPPAADANTDQPSASNQAATLLDSARTAFSQGDYATALTQCTQAAARLPNSGLPHEFRGLILFALKQYKEAAGPVYAVLSVGPGWNWETLCSFYPQNEVYVAQLRALEQYVEAHPDEAEARFLLAYHYMVEGHNDAAADQFKVAAQLNPKDQVSAQLLRALTTKDATPAPEAAAPSKPVDAASLTGQWKAVRADGATIALSLTADHQYTWTYAQQGKPQTFSGTYTLADNLLILKQGNNPMMVGQVSMLPNNQFNFRLAGDTPTDPGLTFGK
jgi:tetratricopeptide (TPR) repeat protein